MKRSGEPCDRKRSRTVRRGAFGKVPTGQLARRLPYTVFLNLLAERAAAVAGMQVIGIDAFANGFRVEAALAGAKCYAIGMNQIVNILDVVYGHDTDGGWLPNQVLHVVGQLSLLLGEPGQTPDGKKRYIPRVFSTRERGVLGRVIQALYHERQITPDTPITCPFWPIC